MTYPLCYRVIRNIEYEDNGGVLRGFAVQNINFDTDKGIIAQSFIATKPLRSRFENPGWILVRLNYI